MAAPITLDLHSQLYPRHAIDRAVASYATLGEIQVEVVGQYTRVTIRAGAGTPDLGRAFANHVLSLTMVDGPDADNAAPPPPGAADAG
jgi:hypothetical protein